MMRYLIIIPIFLFSCFNSKMENKMERLSIDSTKVFNIDADINEIDDLSDLSEIDDIDNPTAVIDFKTKRSLIEYTLDTLMTINKSNKLIVKVKNYNALKTKNAEVEIFQNDNNINIIPISTGKQTVDNNNWTTWEWNLLPIREGNNSLSIYLNINEDNFNKNIKIGEHVITISPDMNNYWYIRLNVNSLKVNEEETFNVILSKDSISENRFIAPYNGEIKLNINDAIYTTHNVDFFSGSYYEYNFKHKITGNYTAISTGYYIVGKPPIKLFTKEIENETNVIIKVSTWMDYIQSSYPLLWSLIPLFLAWIARRIHRHIKIRNLIRSIEKNEDLDDQLARCEEALNVIESKLIKECIIIIVGCLENREEHINKINAEIKQIKRNLYLNYINF